MSRFPKSHANFPRTGPGLGVNNTASGPVLFSLAPPAPAAQGSLPGFSVIPYDATHVMVTVSTLLGEIPSGMYAGDDPIFSFTVTNGDRIYAKAVLDPLTGEVTARTIEKGSTFPADNPDDGEYHWLLAQISIPEDEPMQLSWPQERFGPIEHLAINLPGYSGDRGVPLLRYEGHEGRRGFGLRTLKGEDGTTVRVDPDNEGRILIGAGIHQLQLFQSDAYEVTIRAGMVHNQPVTQTTFSVADGDSVWVKFPVEFDDSTGAGDWIATSDGRSVGHGAPVDSEDADYAVVFIGYCAVDGSGNVTFKLAGGGGTMQARYGPIAWSRPGGASSYVSDWISPGP